MGDAERAAQARQVFQETAGGGSTVNINSGEFAQPHWGDEVDPNLPSHYIVGGEPHPVTGQRYDTISMRAPSHMLSSAQWAGVSPATRALPEFTEQAVAGHIAERRGHQAEAAAAGRRPQPGASLGTWAVPEGTPRHGQIDIDASAMHTDKFAADEVATARGEEAIFGTNPGRNIPTRIGAAKGMEYHPVDMDLREHHRRLSDARASAQASANEGHLRRIA